jgi:hypothetical protein
MPFMVCCIFATVLAGLKWPILQQIDPYDGGFYVATQHVGSGFASSLGPLTALKPFVVARVQFGSPVFWDRM